MNIDYFGIGRLRLRNNARFQFHLRVRDVLAKTDIAALKIWSLVENVSNNHLIKKGGTLYDVL
jgi:hypothetical protein